MTNRCLYWIKDNNTDKKYHKCRTKCPDGKYFCCINHTPKNLEDMLECCDVCCNELTIQDLIILKCNHAYHKLCYFKWLNKNNSNICPICNYSYQKHKKTIKKWVKKKTNNNMSSNDENNNESSNISSSNTNNNSASWNNNIDNNSASWNNNTNNNSASWNNNIDNNIDNWNSFSTNNTSDNNDESLKPEKNIHIPLNISNNNTTNDAKKSMDFLSFISKSINNIEKNKKNKDNINDTKIEKNIDNYDINKNLQKKCIFKDINNDDFFDKFNKDDKDESSNEYLLNIKDILHNNYKAKNNFLNKSDECDIFNMLVDMWSYIDKKDSVDVKIIKDIKE